MTKLADMTEEEKRLRELLPFATPAPWFAATRKGSWDWLVASEDGVHEICQMFHDGTEENLTGEANSALVAFAPIALSELDRLRAEVKRITDDYLRRHKEATDHFEALLEARATIERLEREVKEATWRK